jgi:hypothetical protein
MTDFPLDGPHSPQTVSAAAGQAAEALRYLCYATRLDQDGLREPDDVYALLDPLYTAAARYPQLLAQIVAHLCDWRDGTRLASTSGHSPSPAVRNAVFELDAAETAAAYLTARLRETQNAISGLYLKDDPDA